MHLKSIRMTPSLISFAVTPVPRPGTSTMLPRVTGVVVVGVVFFTPVPQAESAPITTSTATSARGVRAVSRKRDEFYQVVGPVVDGAVGHHQHAVGLEL